MYKEIFLEFGIDYYICVELVYRINDGTNQYYMLFPEKTIMQDNAL